MSKMGWYLCVLALLISCGIPRESSRDYLKIDTTYPEQTNKKNLETIIVERAKNTYIISPRAEYKVGAVVGRKKRYRRDAMAPVAPYDLALFWGILAYPENLRQITVRQNRRRYYFFLKRDAKLSTDWVYLNSSNNHIIPANDNIRRALSLVRKNETIEIEGYLVDVRAIIDGRSSNWKTSMVRDDTGDGACEIIYVTKLRREFRVYE